jgi:hypothetical protein
MGLLQGTGAGLGRGRTGPGSCRGGRRVPDGRRLAERGERAGLARARRGYAGPDPDANGERDGDTYEQDRRHTHGDASARGHRDDDRHGHRDTHGRARRHAHSDAYPGPAD